MTDEELDALSDARDALSSAQKARLDELMISADWLCNNGFVTWRDCSAAEAAMLEIVIKEQA